MKTLVCYLLEGLREQGHFAAWVTLDRFATLEEAQAASAEHDDPSIVNHRIVPYYRVSRNGAPASRMVRRVAAAPSRHVERPATAMCA